MKIGIVGCGKISGIYLKNLTTVFGNVTVYACADLDAEKAEQAAKTYGIPHVMTYDEMLADGEIGMILNLTTPQSHYILSKRALEAGKHVYVEKPLALTYAEGKELLDIATERGLYIGCAPDTFLGAGIQTSAALIQSGAIGRPVAGAAYMMCHGHESWHPAPAFYYDFGGGPLFDMGPYYITALVRLLGRAERVFAYGGRAFETRTVTSKERYGEVIPVKVDTHNAGIIRFENGAIVTLVTSFDVWKHSMPKIELYGTDGSLKVPDPNTFGGPVLLATKETKQFEEMPLVSPYCENSRGIGLSETVLAIEEGRINHASGALGLHVLEIMEAFVKSAESGKEIILESTPPDAVALDWSVKIGEIQAKR